MSQPCVKCGGTVHYGREIKASGEGIDLLPISFFRSGYLLVRICGGCGHTELRVPERFLEKVREKFPQID